MNCKGCGGILGRDCFNQLDCIQISRNNEQYYNEQILREEYEHFNINNYTILELLNEIFKRFKLKLLSFKNKKEFEKMCKKDGMKIEDLPF